VRILQSLLSQWVKRGIFGNLLAFRNAKAV
jgi:hypothetical protein